MLIAPFNAVFNKGDADPKLGAKLKAELPGILNRVLESYKTLTARGDFAVVESVDEALKDYREGEDMVLAWFNDMVEVTTDNTDKHPSAEVFASYLSYCEAENAKYDMQIKQIAFTRRLRKIHPFYKQFRENNRVTRGFTHLKLIDATAF
jgi:phage/plasmid-associated DNA primase